MSKGGSKPSRKQLASIVRFNFQLVESNEKAFFGIRCCMDLRCLRAEMAIWNMRTRAGELEMELILGLEVA